MFKRDSVLNSNFGHGEKLRKMLRVETTSTLVNRTESNPRPVRHHTNISRHSTMLLYFTPMLTPNKYHIYTATIIIKRI